MVDELNGAWREITHCGFPSSVAQQWKWKLLQFPLWPIGKISARTGAHDWLGLFRFSHVRWLKRLAEEQNKPYFPAITFEGENLMVFCATHVRKNVNEKTKEKEDYLDHRKSHRISSWANWQQTCMSQLIVSFIFKRKGGLTFHLSIELAWNSVKCKNSFNFYLF